MGEKFWVNQKIWDTKREAYEDILSSLYLTKNYVAELSYFYENLKINSSLTTPDIPIEYQEQNQESYDQYVEEAETGIENIQREFEETQDSKDAWDKRLKLEADVKKSIESLESIFFHEISLFTVKG